MEFIVVHLVAYSISIVAKLIEKVVHRYLVLITVGNKRFQKRKSFILKIVFGIYIMSLVFVRFQSNKYKTFFSIFYNIAKQVFFRLVRTMKHLEICSNLKHLLPTVQWGYRLTLIVTFNRTTLSHSLHIILSQHQKQDDTAGISNHKGAKNIGKSKLTKC